VWTPFGVVVTEGAFVLDLLAGVEKGLLAEEEGHSVLLAGNAAIPNSQNTK
jgi:hypothetical protein